MKTAKRTGLCHLLPLGMAVVVGAALSPANVVWASDPGSAPLSTEVQLSAIDLSTPERVAALYRRIRNAARSVCGYADSRFREEQAAWDKCVEDAIGHAVARVDSATLTDYYLARAKRSQAVPATEGPKVVNRAR
jgi:UrcA family protein